MTSRALLSGWLAKRHWTAVLGALAVAKLTSACLDLPVQPEPESDVCTLTSDCPTGQVCIDRRCYGDPPGGAFALVVSPPNASELSPSQFADVDISQLGDLGSFYLGPQVEYSARIRGSEACDDCTDPVAAWITVSEAAAFVGGPRLLQTVQLAEQAQGTFSLRAPPVGGRDYTILLTPQDTPKQPWSSLLPPWRAPISVLDGSEIELRVPTRRIRGFVAVQGMGAADYIVSATGRMDPGRPKERVSTIVRTSASGEFELFVADHALEEVELAIQPPSAVVAPTARLELVLDESVSDVGVIDLQPSPTTTVAWDAYGYGTSGETLAMTIGQIIIEAEYTPSGSLRRSFRVERSIQGPPEPVTVPSDADAYFLSILPVAPMELAGIYRYPVSLAELSGSWLLPRRTAVVGIVQGPDGSPVSGASVTADLSVNTLWNQPRELQSVLRLVPAPTATTAPDGSFLLWVDTRFASTSRWRIQLIPSTASLPRWSVTQEVTSTERVDLGLLRLPASRGVRANVRGPNGAPIVAGTADLYRVASVSPCLTTAFPPEACELPPNLLATATTDADGMGRLVLPDVLPAP